MKQIDSSIQTTTKTEKQHKSFETAAIATATEIASVKTIPPMNFMPTTTALAHNHQHQHHILAHPHPYQQHNHHSDRQENNNSRGSHSSSHSKAMEWTNDDALELIEQYRIHTELWNRADPKYKDKLCRFRAWSEIAERFGCSKAEVERKMNVLLTQYRREKHKMLVKLYEGIQPNPSKWYAFKRFDFMEVGGGSSVLTPGSSGSNGRSSAPSVDLTNGHHHQQHQQQQHSQHLNSHHHHSGGQHHAHSHHLNGLTSAFERSTNAVAAAVAAAATVGAVAGTTTTTFSSTPPTAASSLHRRMKSKEMKYFGAMGLNLPMLIANSQNLDTWNTVGQYSPPIDRSQLRVPMPISFSASAASAASQQNELNVPNPGTRSLFGGSSNSDYTASPQKPMDTSDIDEKDDIKTEQSRMTPTAPSSVATSNGNGTPGNGVLTAVGAASSAGGNIGGAGPGSSSTRNTESVEREINSSPIPNTNTHEAHKTLITQHQQHHQQQQQDDLDIKQELVDYFHAPHPPAPPESHHSYSSNNDERLSNADAEDFAQDLRVTAAAAAAAAKTLDFSQFVLPRNLRRSTESSSLDEKYTPLNMRKLSTTSPNAVGSNSAGQMLMNSLLAHESMSEDTASVGGGGRGGDLKNSSSQEATAAAAAALYAECLNKDDCDFIGANVSLKLRAMDRTQRIIAEKLISEVLFYGQFNELERNARILPK